MPVVHKSTIRRARQSVKRQARNRATLGALKSLVKKVQAAVAEKKVEDAKVSLRQATLSGRSKIPVWHDSPSPSARALA